MKKTFEKEYTPLLAIKDAYPKLIITRTCHETYDYQGIQVIDPDNVWMTLLYELNLQCYLTENN